MFGGEFTRGANGARPVELKVCPIAKPHFLFEKTNQLTGFAGIDQPGTLCLPECVEDLNALPRSPENLRVRFAVEERDCIRMMRVATTFVSESPRGVRVDSHFLSERRKTTPSNFGAFASPTARFSARRRVMRRRGVFTRGVFVRPFRPAGAAFIYAAMVRYAENRVNKGAGIGSLPSCKHTKSPAASCASSFRRREMFVNDFP